MRTIWKKTIGVAAVAAAITAGGAGLALADDVQIDNDTATPGVQHQVDLTVAPGDPINISAQTVVSAQGSKHLLAGSDLTIHNSSATGTVLPNLSVPDATGTVPSPWDDSSPDFTISNTITFNAPSTPSAPGTPYTTILKFLPTSFTCADTGCLSFTATGDPFIINLTVTGGGGGGTGSGNTAPTVAFTSPPTSTNEGSTETFNFTITDPDAGNTQSYVSGYPDCGTGNTISGTPTITNTGGSFDCTFPDGVVPAVNSTVSVQVNDGTDNSNLATTDIEVDNVNPTVATPAFSVTSVNCRTAVTLNGVSFSDPGVNDATWVVDINWGDGSTDTTINASTQGLQSPSPTHSYTTPGTYQASVTVTDKDGGANTATTSSNSVQVLQVYNTTFLQPFDGSSPSRLITNTMKSGRVVPVKATIFDVCTDAWVPSTANVTIIVGAAGVSSPPASDAVESYADAGASSAGTNQFRWTADSTFAAGGFWIYNLDSKALNLQIGKTYRVDIRVGSNLATGNTWALLTPVK